MCRKFAVAAAAMYQHSVPRKKNIWCVLDYHSMFLSLKRENIRVRGFHLVSLSKMIKKAMKQRKLSLIVYMRDVDHMTSMNRWYFRWSFIFSCFFRDIQVGNMLCYPTKLLFILGNQLYTLPETWHEGIPTEKDRIVFQQSIFRGELLVLGSVNGDSSQPLHESLCSPTSVAWNVMSFKKPNVH